MAKDLGKEDQETPLLENLPSPSIGAHATTKRTGNLWTATAHIITGVIGSGVPSLAWSVAQLGWTAGPLAIVIFAGIVLGAAFLLCDCYRSPDPEFGLTRNRSYIEAVKSNLGSKSVWICGLFQQINLYGIGIAYTITSAISLRAIQRSNCFHKEGHNAPCEYGDSTYMLLFGGIQIIFSQIRNFHKMGWLSILAAIMSFCYSFAGLGLALAKVVENKRIKGSIGGIPTRTAVQKVWNVSQAIGDIAFAYPFSIILIEIQDTLKSPPPENQTMKKASSISIMITTVFYLCCGCFGYAAFGSETPGNLLTGFGFYEPYWLVNFANACIVIHLVGAYQVYSQPVFALVERWSTVRFPNNGFVNNSYTIKLPLFRAFKVNLFRLCFRTFYVVTTTGLGMLFPYFNQVLGVLGALNFWPLAIYFPLEMHFVQRAVRAWTKEWFVLQSFSIACLMLTTVAMVGSVEGLVTAKLR